MAHNMRITLAKQNAYVIMQVTAVQSSKVTSCYQSLQI